MKRKRLEGSRSVLVLWLGIAVIAFMALGIKLMWSTMAAGFIAATEAESGTLSGPAASIDDAAASAGKAVKFGGGSGTGFPANQSAPPDLSMIPPAARVIARLDYNTGDFSQWDEELSHCPSTNEIKIDQAVLRTPDSVASAKYRVSGICENLSTPARRAEVTGNNQNDKTDVREGDERWYYLSVKPAADMPTPRLNYFIVTQWHPGDGSPPLTLNFNKGGSVDLGGNNLPKWGNDSDFGNPEVTIGPIRKGVWTDYVLHIKFSNNRNNGWVEAWENGVQTVQRTPYKSMSSDSSYMKQGMYTAYDEGDTVHELWHDGMTVWAPQ